MTNTHHVKQDVTKGHIYAVHAMQPKTL